MKLINKSKYFGMKVVSDYKIELDTIIGTKLQLSATLILLEDTA